VGGSDAFAEPKPYIQAGARAVILDKSGAVNASVLDHVLKKKPRGKLTKVIFSNGDQPKGWLPLLRPEEWALPSINVAKQCLGYEYWREPFPQEMKPIGSVFSDIGCDRQCDFCQTPNYHLGYSGMSPKRTLQWVANQKEAGARSIIFSSDQFLGRLLWPNGRDDVIEIMKGVREIGLPALWPNGIELRKATVSRGFNKKDSDLTPDDELIEAVWGWDGKVGSFHAFIPAERPIVGRESYAKLLPWQEHRALLKAIVRSGIPAITYGIIIGLPEDDEVALKRLEEAISELYQELITINPQLHFKVAPYSIFPIPGTPQMENLRKLGLLRFEDPLLAGLTIAVCDTLYMSYEEVSDWQIRLAKIGPSEHKLLSATPGFTGY